MSINHILHLKLEKLEHHPDAPEGQQYTSEFHRATVSILTEHMDQYGFTVEDFKKAIETYIKFRKSPFKGRRRRLNKSFLEEHPESLEFYYKNGKISRATYFRYLKELKQKK